MHSGNTTVVPLFLVLDRQVIILIVVLSRTSRVNLIVAFGIVTNNLVYLNLLTISSEKNVFYSISLGIVVESILVTFKEDKKVIRKFQSLR